MTWDFVTHMTSQCGSGSAVFAKCAVFVLVRADRWSHPDQDSPGWLVSNIVNF